MNEKKMWNRLLFVVTMGVFLLVGYGFTTNPSVEAEDRPPVPWKIFGDEVSLSWTPTGADRTLKPAQCQRAILSDLIQSHPKDVHGLARKVQDWLAECDFAVPSPRYNTYQVLLDFFLINYDYRKDPRIRVAEYHLKGGRVLRGILAVHPDSGPRPFVIVQCGVVCDLKNGPDKASALMHLFEEGGYHVLILASASSALYAKDNGEMFVSGREEGAQMIEVIDQIYHSEHKARISEFHLMGISLGGHAALYASRMALRRPELPIGSALAMCPVVDLEAQMKSVLGEDYKGYIFDRQIREVFRLSQEKVPQIQDIAHDLDGVTREEIRDKILRGSYELLVGRKTVAERFGWKKPKTYEAFLDDLKFQLHAHKPGVPTLVIHATDDMVVSSAINAQQLPEDARNLGVLTLPRGNHCAFNQGIEWSTYSEILRGFFDKYSGAAKISKPEEIILDVSQLKIEGGGRSGEELLGATWIITPKPYRLGLQLTFKSTRKAHLAGTYCHGVTDYKLPDFCLERRTLVIDGQSYKKFARSRNLEQLYLDSDYPALAQIARWLNSHSKVINSNGQLAVGLRGWPSQIVLQRVYN